MNLRETANNPLVDEERTRTDMVTAALTAARERDWHEEKERLRRRAQERNLLLRQAEAPRAA